MFKCLDTTLYMHICVYLTPFHFILFRYEKTVPQVLLHWSVQKNYITIPKTTRKERILENADVFDFVLSEEDMKILVCYSTSGYVETTDGETKSSVLHVFALLRVHLFFRDAIVKKPYVTPIKPL